MKTVSSICAAGSSTALSAVGLALARPDDYDHPLSSTSTRRRLAPTPNEDMTAVAAYPASSPFANSNGQPRRLVSEGDDGRLVGSIRIPNKRRSGPEKATGFTPSMSQTSQRDGERRGGQPGTPSSTWFRRLSSNMSSSRDSSRTPTSRPASAVLSQSNGSIAVSHAGSTTPIFQDTTPSYSAPNKLVKRTSSVHNQSSPLQASGSKLPILRRPATSHQRSATLNEGFHISNHKTRQSLDGTIPNSRNTQWRHYFTPRISSEEVAQSRRRSATGIPNPIKRVFPDRRYVPTLVSAKDLARPVDVELDEDIYVREDDAARAEADAPGSTASSPFPNQIAHFEESTAPRRSFSISDLLSTGPQPLWKRPSSSSSVKGRPWSSRSARNGRPRVLSESRASMGNRLSSHSINESERPAKRRDLTDPEISRRSIYSSANNSTFGKADVGEIELGLDADIHSLLITSTEPPAVAAVCSEAPSSPRDQPPVQPAAVLPAKSSRLSATPSEITSTVGSDSDTRSVGDNSTDYQSDTFYDSYPTRTTRSSSGRRGPHIETIFDESPPNFSSGRSTKLRDFLSDGHFPEDEYGHYRHSTIEEEESVLSTPVRSLHNKSVTSTPSARPGAQHTFSSSPPVMNVVAELDDLDWDAPEAEQRSSPEVGSRLPSDPFQFGIARGLPVRFGPALQLADANSTASTPQRNGNVMKERANLFELAEQQPSPNYATNSPPRPKTVHGKKDQDSRWSRPTGRRGPSAMHARSHSVPVVPEQDGKRDNVVANKFGTWGVGSKAVTEDWDEDFDFDPPQLPVQSAMHIDEKRIDSGHEMFVPRSIREQQENVVANISLLREWGLLIEELKELRIRAVGLDMLNGPYAQSWREVDAMIELADQESAEHTLEPRASPPSSPGFDYTAFEEPSASIDDTVRTKQTPKDVESSLKASSKTQHLSTPQPKHVGNRPRKDSELVAQSVIAALQSRNSSNDTTAAQAVGPTKKVPFDTATLRHIVPYVNGLKRLVKDALRETEGLYSSPRRRSSPEQKTCREAVENGSPAFRNMFREPQDDDDDNTMPRRRQSRRELAATEDDIEQHAAASRPPNPRFSS